MCNCYQKCYLPIVNILYFWRSWLVPVVLILYTICLILALPFFIFELFQTQAPPILSAWIIAGVFLALALPISFYTILLHIVNYTRPYLQRHIIRILWMVPIYAFTSWLSLRFGDISIYLITCRELYEAYVLYNFMAYWLNYLTHERPAIDRVVASQPPIEHSCPLHLCLSPWPLGRSFINRCKHGVLQYAFFRLITTIIALIASTFKFYNEDEFNFGGAWIYLVTINSFSQLWALYCLVLFYRGMKEELAPTRPIAKFLCVKVVVFLTFWQQVLLTFLVLIGVIRPIAIWHLDKPKAITDGIQNLLICIEMFLVAVAHHFAYSHRPFVLSHRGRGFLNNGRRTRAPADEASASNGASSSGYDGSSEQQTGGANGSGGEEAGPPEDPLLQTTWTDRLRQVMSVQDVKRDFIEHIRVIGTTIDSMRHGSQTSGGSHRERRPLLRSEMGASGYGSRGHTDSSSNDEFVPAAMTVPPPDAQMAENAVEATASSVAAVAEQQSHLPSLSSSASASGGAAGTGTRFASGGVSTSMPTDEHNLSSLIAQSTIHPLCLENTVARLDARGGSISVRANTLAVPDRPTYAEPQQQTLLTIRSVSLTDESLVALAVSGDHSAAPPVHSTAPQEDTRSLIDLS